MEDIPLTLQEEENPRVQLDKYPLLLYHEYLFVPRSLLQVHLLHRHPLPRRPHLRIEQQVRRSTSALI